MIIYKEGLTYDIEEKRIALNKIIIPERSRETNAIQSCEVLVDGEIFTMAVAIFIEHKQYIVFKQLRDSIDFRRLFPEYKSMVFIDMGTIDKYGDPAHTLFKDYSEKGREGISYFSDVVIDSDKNGDFKRSYVPMEVRV